MFFVSLVTLQMKEGTEEAVEVCRPIIIENLRKCFVSQSALLSITKNDRIGDTDVGLSLWGLLNKGLTCNVRQIDFTQSPDFTSDGISLFTVLLLQQHEMLANR